jgi:hypothetical protein
VNHSAPSALCEVVFFNFMQAAKLWNQGKDTRDIAWVMAKPEHRVYHHLETIKSTARALRGASPIPAMTGRNSPSGLTTLFDTSLNTNLGHGAEAMALSGGALLGSTYQSQKMFTPLLEAKRLSAA